MVSEEEIFELSRKRGSESRENDFESTYYEFSTAASALLRVQICR
jgi:hypothetical protein